LKSIIFLLLILSCAILFAESSFYMVSINPSSTSHALGDVTGVADVWSGDPLNTWSNPALAAFNEGFRIGYMHDKYLEDGYYIEPKLYFNSTYLSYAKNGWGFSLPMLNASGKFGSTFDYGKMGYIDSQEENIPDVKKSYDTNSEISVAYDPLVKAKTKDSRPFVQALNASIGVSVSILTARYEQQEYNDEYELFVNHITADAYPLNVGMLMRFDGAQYFNLKNMDLQASLGLEATNISGTRITFKDDNGSYPSDPLPKDYRFGVGLMMGLPMSLVEAGNTPFTAYCPHVLTLLFMEGKLARENDMDENGKGFEIGLLDILYYRMGNVDYIGDSNVNNTSGWGIKLHGGKKWEFKYNAAEFYNGGYEDSHSQDISFTYFF
jgi:hypothetical protein